MAKFMKLHYKNNNEMTFINFDLVTEFSRDENDGSIIYFCATDDGDLLRIKVAESIEDIISKLYLKS